jgi:hypothetical protein
MSKEQINYLLVLATLLVVWLYFNTFYVNAKRNFGGGSFPGMMSASSRRSPNPIEIPKIPEPPRIADLLRGQPQGGQASAAPKEMPLAPSNTSQTDKTPNS